MSKLRDWAPFVAAEKEKFYYKNLVGKLSTYSPAAPAKSDIFKPLYLTPFANTRVVIIGPYPHSGEPTGLAFACKNYATSTNSALKAILKEVSFCGLDTPYGVIEGKYDLVPWAEQGVLLWNNVATRMKHVPHFDFGWELFTINLVAEVAKKLDPVVFMLWGENTHALETTINPYGGESRHLILKTDVRPGEPEDCDYNGRFTGCRHFQKANLFFRERGLPLIDWSQTGSEEGEYDF